MIQTLNTDPIDERVEEIPERPVLRVRLLGELEATWDGSPIRPESRGARRLLAVLATQRRTRGRVAIAADLWPEGGSSVGAWLRQALWHLRKAFDVAGANPDEVFEPSSERLGFRLALAIELDARRFGALLAGDSPDLRAALELYGGDFGEGLDLDCFASEREQLSDLYEDALVGLARSCLREGDLESARDAARELIARDPLREEAHATLIEVLGRTGTRDQVVRQYRRLARILDDELGVLPLAETQEAFRIAMRRTAQRSAQTVAFGTLTLGQRTYETGLGGPNEIQETG